MDLSREGLYSRSELAEENSAESNVEDVSIEITQCEEEEEQE